MKEPDNWFSNGLNWVVNQGMDLLNYDTRRRPPSEDNPFYRDNAQNMPGWGNTFGLDFMDPGGIPSGAWAQDRATNYVGQDDPTGVWDGVRRGLVSREDAMIQDHGQLSFGDVYGAHVDAYSAAQANDPTGHSANGFIDPLSFGAAVYGAPLLEHFGINTGPITGTSIDLFNDPTDSATGGWGKRMGLGAGEMGAGALMMSNPITFLPGLAMAGAGAFGMGYNTVTAFQNGMAGEWGDAISSGAHSLANGASNLGSQALNAGGNLLNGAVDMGGRALSGAADLGSQALHGAGNLASGAVDLGGRALSGAGDLLSSAFHW